ncbi:MAG: SapC family protein [Magnetococcales bacterium]|nr:SapC family protein [Magnetococcales bacterium]
MFQNIVPVNAQRHAATRIKEMSSFLFASHFHIAYVTVHEFARAAATYPIIFIEDRAHDTFRPVALLGMTEGENLFVDAEGKWLSSYIPAIIRRYPFVLSQTGTDPGQFVVCIDEDCGLLSETEGSALFTETGQPTQVIENVKRYLSELQQLDLLTGQFTRFLTEHNMLTPMNMRVRESDQIKNISGCYVINEERLNNLSNDRFIDLRGKHYLPAIYAHLISLAQIERLAMLRDARGKGTVKGESLPPELATGGKTPGKAKKKDAS